MSLFVKLVFSSSGIRRMTLLALMTPISLKKVRAHISLLISTDTFYLTTGTHIWIRFLFALPTFYVIFILSLTPFLPHFCLVFSSIFLLSLGLNFTAFSAHVASWHAARLRPNILILLESG